MTPTSKSKQLLESEGYLVAIVERWNPFAKIRQDLYGIVDLLAVNSGSTVAVQTTTAAHMSDRRKKLQASDALRRLVDANWTIELHGWVKRGRRWEVNREVLG